MLLLWFVALTIFVGSGAGIVQIKPNILGPPLPHRPFVVTWDVASDQCEEKYGVNLDLTDFDIVYNENKGWKGSSLVIFYSDQLGYHPKIVNGTSIYGGIPQLGDLNAHLTKAEQDIANFIPDPEFEGLAVIDWESWHPLWDRMTWGKFLVYRNKSIEKVKMEHPDWTQEEVEAKAKSEYNTAAWAFFSYTLSLGRILRPQALWGYYLFPDCYNYDKNLKKTDLRCKNSTIYMNDEIQWLFDKSTALYPSIYLGEWFKDNKTAVDYVAYRILEAVRVDGNRPGDVSAPIFAYHLIAYRLESKFLDRVDLRNSIGMAALLGASGVTIWGDHYLANSVEVCKNLSNYLLTTLGPYVKQTADAAARCSFDFCSGNGRCVLSKYPQEDGSTKYLGVDDAKHIMRQLNKAAYMAFDNALRIETFGDKYMLVCQCYNGWSGEDCSDSRL